MANSAAPQNESDWVKLAFLLGTVFRPSTPVQISELFAGRSTQILKICDAINQHGRHAILYGEPGVGKTSCANMIFPNLYSTGHSLLIPQVNCMGSDNFGAIWKRVFEEMKLKIDDSDEMVLPENAEKLISDYTAPYGEPLTPDIVRRILHDLAKEFLVVIVLDEFDKIEDPDTRQAIAHFVKFLSDRNAAATIILIGVADDIEQLIEDHRSIERCMSQVPIPRINRDDLESVVTKGLGQHKMGCGNFHWRDLRGMGRMRL